LDDARRHNPYKSWQKTLWSDLKLESVPQNHPDAILSITKPQFKLLFAQSRKVDFAKFVADAGSS
jgi:hypothetical protein